MEGLRSFIKEDNHRAVDVGLLREGVRLFKVQMPNFSEGYYPEAAIREGADELTLRAEEVGTRPSSMLSTLRTTDGCRRWLMRTGVPSAKQSTKELNGMNGKSCTVTTERGAGQQEPKSQVRVKKEKTLWAMKAAKDREEEYYDPARKDDIV